MFGLLGRILGGTPKVSRLDELTMSEALNAAEEGTLTIGEYERLCRLMERLKRYGA